MSGSFIQYLTLIFLSLNYLLTFISNYKSETIIIKTIILIFSSILLFFLLKNKKKNIKFIISNGKIWLTIFICFLIVSILWSENRTFGLLKIYQFLSGVIPIIISLSLHRILFDKIKWNSVIRLLILLISLLSIIIILFPPVKFENFIIKNILLSHVFTGRLLIIGIIIALTCLIFENYRTTLNLILFGTMSLALHQIALRSGIISTFVVLTFLTLLFRNEKKTLKRLILAILIFLLTFIFALNFFQNLQNRLPKLSTNSNNVALNIKKDITVDVRIKALKEGIDIFQESPLWGKGCGSFNSKNSLRKNLNYPHNLIVEILSETGILGLICVVIIFYYLIKHIRKSTFKIKVTLLIIVVYYMILAQFSKNISTNLIFFSLLFFDNKNDSK